MREVKLQKTFDKFTKAMKRRLNHKERHGWRGWDQPRYYDILNRAKDKLRAHPDDPDDLVDVANFCMMLWFRCVSRIGGKRE